MNKRAYLHQFNQLGEATVPAIADTLRSAGITEIVCKTHQATTFLGRFDKSALAFNSLADVESRRAEFAAQGITMRSWFVPMGEDIQAEANLAAQVASILGNQIELDLEPYHQFWDGPKTDLLPFLDALSTRNVKFDIDLDIRPGGYQPFPDIAEALKRADTVYTQSYWTDFGQSWTPVVASAIQTVRELAGQDHKVGIIFPWNGAADYTDAWAFTSSHGVDTVGMWKMGDAGPNVYAALAALNDSPPQDDFVTRVSSRTKAIDVLGDLWALAEGRRAAGDRGAADDLEAGIIRLKQLLGLP